jgi:hypothetical protein
MLRLRLPERTDRLHSVTTLPGHSPGASTSAMEYSSIPGHCSHSVLRPVACSHVADSPIYSMVAFRGEIRELLGRRGTSREHQRRLGCRHSSLKVAESRTALHCPKRTHTNHRALAGWRDALLRVVILPVSSKQTSRDATRRRARRPISLPTRSSVPLRGELRTRFDQRTFHEAAARSA